MVFADETRTVLNAAAALVNTAANGIERLRTGTDVVEVLAGNGISDVRKCAGHELAPILEFRAALHHLWSAADRGTLVAQVNEILAGSEALPRLVRHDDWDWHLHFARASSALHVRIRAEIGMGLAEVVRLDEASRLRTCAAPDCDAVLVDLSKNRSRLYCSTGNCGNRLHVARYRSRLDERDRDSTSTLE